MLHTRLYFLFVFVFPKMEAPNFESIFECISDGVNKVHVLVLVLVIEPISADEADRVLIFATM